MRLQIERVQFGGKRTTIRDNFQVDLRRGFQGFEFPPQILTIHFAQAMLQIVIEAGEIQIEGRARACSARSHIRASLRKIERQGR